MVADLSAIRSAKSWPRKLAPRRAKPSIPSTPRDETAMTHHRLPLTASTSATPDSRLDAVKTADARATDAAGPAGARKRASSWRELRTPWETNCWTRSR